VTAPRAIVLGIALLLAAGAAASAAPTLHVDPTGVNTLIFRDYTGGSDPNAPTFNANWSHASTTATQVGSSLAQSVSGGASLFTFNLSPAGSQVIDPRVEYNDGAGAWDHGVYPWVRMRFQQSTTARGTVQLWERPAEGGEGIDLSTASTYTERRGNPDSDANVSNIPSNNSGFRFDPFSIAADGDAIAVDYIMIDRYETFGMGEWDRDGDANGWNYSANGAITNVTIANGIFAGVGNGDAIMETGQTFNADLFKFIEIRMRSESTNLLGTQLFWGANGAYSEAKSTKFGAADQQFHTYLIDMSNEATWTGTDMRLRLDPVQGTNLDFEIDYVRLRADAVISAIPTPAALPAGAALLTMLGVRRRR
jgi:hypothetical protein